MTTANFPLDSHEVHQHDRANFPYTGGFGRGGACSTGYMVSLCGVCKEPTPLSGRQIDFVHVCEFCFDLHKISYNPVEHCPYKRPKSRKLPVKPTPIKYELSSVNSL
jgi:hypothetical protein